MKRIVSLGVLFVSAFAICATALAQPGPGFGPGGPGGPGGGIVNNMPLMNVLDADGNGELSADELDAAPVLNVGPLAENNSGETKT